MENLLVNKSADIQKAVEGIFDFFDTCMSYSELVDEVLDCSIKVLESYQDVDNCDGDTRPMALVHDMRMMLDLVKPFAELMGQNDKSYRVTWQYGRSKETQERIKEYVESQKKSA